MDMEVDWSLFLDTDRKKNLCEWKSQSQSLRGGEAILEQFLDLRVLNSFQNLDFSAFWARNCF